MFFVTLTDKVREDLGDRYSEKNVYKVATVLYSAEHSNPYNIVDLVTMHKRLSALPDEDLNYRKATNFGPDTFNELLIAIAEAREFYKC